MIRATADILQLLNQCGLWKGDRSMCDINSREGSHSLILPRRLLVDLFVIDQVMFEYGILGVNVLDVIS